MSGVVREPMAATRSSVYGWGGEREEELQEEGESARGEGRREKGATTAHDRVGVESAGKQLVGVVQSPVGPKTKKTGAARTTKKAKTQGFRTTLSIHEDSKTLLACR
jgi:hypothetical protein